MFYPLSNSTWYNKPRHTKQLDEDGTYELILAQWDLFQTAHFLITLKT